MRLDSPVVLAIAGTLAIHLILAVLGDALVVSFPPRTIVPAPVVELIDIEPLPPPEPPPPPVVPPAPAAQPEQPAPTPVEPKPQKIAAKAPPPPPSNEPPPPPSDTPPDPNSGGAPVTTMENIAPSATGVPVARGVRTSERVGRGGTGTGTGAGSGPGSSDAPKPVSVATIKTRAMPRGDFSYFDASKHYPPEATSLGIEGVIRVRLIVDETGKVKSAVLLNTLGHGLDELALTQAKRIEFEPAKDTDDKPVTSVVVWTFNMTLPKSK